MDKDASTYLKQILDSIILIEDYIQGATKEQFLQNKLLQDSVAMRLHLIGEICNKLPNDFRERMPEIPWAEIIGMRNFIGHHYLEIIQETVWNTIKDDLSELKQALLNELNKD